ncbi:uncharacterized protein [Lolium perenne]|uniref:uncharacterized protein n=1 Tax=Lolium perenne TaxID=4522 RepID=UPI0021F5FF43|nr:uncharacterized protein LOC127335734 [Lolium perenne]XP_051223893.1 uncharacterized protein LOC127341987 [Lolium perenne]
MGRPPPHEHHRPHLWERLLPPPRRAACILRDAPPSTPRSASSSSKTARQHASLLPFQSFYQSNIRVRKRGRRFCGGERWPGREARVCSRQRRRRPRDPPTRTRTRRRRPCPAPLAPGSRVLSMKENNRTELTLVIRSSNMISLGQHHHWKTTNVLMVTPFRGLTLPVAKSGSWISGGLLGTWVLG